MRGYCKLYIDFETRSELDVSKVGTHKYAMHPSTEVILLSYALDDGEVVTLTEITDELYELIEDDSVMKIAHNAEFDLAICRYVLGIDTSTHAWYDTAYQAAYFGYPRKLSYLANLLSTTKKAAPTEMLLFSTPRSVKSGDTATDLFGFNTRTWYAERKDYPQEWDNFVLYSRADVQAMRECHKAMPKLPCTEKLVMQMTMQMNFNGVPFDMTLARNIKRMADAYAHEAGTIALNKYGIRNLRSTQEVQTALRSQGVILASLSKKERGGKSHEILDLRDQSTGAAFSKVDKAETRICPDGRLRGEFVGYGAHTGRWSSRGVQLQNFARILGKVSTDLSQVQSYDHLRQHLRLCVHAPKPYQFVCADLSQIEARIVAWLAGCTWRMEAFKNDEDIYSRSAERMFGLPRVDKSMPERQMGKCAELGLGYGGAAGAINRIAPDFYREQGAEKIDDIVQRWRGANPEICQLWRTLERAFNDAMVSGICTATCGTTRITFRYNGKDASISLPSGRDLYYRGVYSEQGRLFYLDYSQGGEYAQRVDFWGGTLLENITQAIARDVLVDIMLRVDLGYSEQMALIGSVHDEVWYLSTRDDGLDVVLEEMARPIKWAEGLVTKGDGFIYERYIK